MRAVAVVGASPAGPSAARSLRKRGYDGRLVVIGDEPHRPHDRPPLSKEFLSGAIGEADLALERDDEDLAAEWVLGTRATGLDRTERAIRLADGRAIRADGVIVATGAAARTLPGTDGLAGVHVLRTLDDARALRDELARSGRLEGSGVELGNGVKCGAGGRTSLAGVVAVGDCANWYDPHTGTHRGVEHWTGAVERPDAAVAALLAHGATEPGVPRPPYFWSDQYGVKIQFAGHVTGADSVTVEEGTTDDRSFLAVYRHAGRPVAVLGMNQPRLFTRRRKQLIAAAP
ncbi:NAD(P)/FAD-dependent oxidoreductase [Streptomyces sp. NPDC020801]|uniref:NAD(P)/FAD-dependent oxidoreductase n=1 Tax=unclassified Streptomyces TaxID=2593676 RepID=UPI00379AD26C